MKPTVIILASVLIGGIGEHVRGKVIARHSTCEAIATITHEHTQRWLREGYPQHWPHYGSQKGMGEIGKH